MPYDSLSDLPASVRDNLPMHAREVYLAAFNNAWEEYKNAEHRKGGASREEVAHKVAWSAVKNKYEKTTDGTWKSQGINQTKRRNKMNKNILEGKWMQLRGAVREKWGQLTDDELDQIAGKRDKLSGVLQERYGYAENEAEKHIDDFLENLDDTD